nr:PREDICTED: WW domain-binding protein 11-like isoform X2 [Rhinolophus sinicus]
MMIRGGTIYACWSPRKPYYTRDFQHCNYLKMSDKAIEDGEGLAAEALLQEFQSDEEDGAPQSSSAGPPPGGPPKGPPPGPDGHGSDSTDPPPKDGGRNFSRTTEEDEVPQSSSAGSTPGGPPQGPPPGPEGHGSDSKDPPPKDGGRNLSRTAVIVAAGVTSGVVAVGTVPVVLGAMGFTGAGIAASSIAAKMMSSAAIANGGGVAAGSLVATLQSVGAAGLSASSNILLGLTGFSFGGLLGAKATSSSPPPGPSTEAERGPHVGGDSPGPQDDSPPNDKPPASPNCSEKDKK